MGEHPRILIVDDDENIRDTTRAILEDEDYLVDTASTGSEAIQKTQETAYNIVLLDIRLPDMEGVELLKLVKDTVPKTRKVMVTGYPSMQNAIASLNKDADAYLTKPIDIENLLSVVKKQLQLQAQERTFSEEKVAEFIATRVKEVTFNEPE